jgi:hypothetical protein
MVAFGENSRFHGLFINPLLPANIDIDNFLAISRTKSPEPFPLLHQLERTYNYIKPIFNVHEF